MGERGGRGDSSSPHVADEVLVHPPTADGMSEFMSLANNIAFLSQSLQEKGTLYYSHLKTLRLTAWKLSGGPSRVLDFWTEVFSTALPSTRRTSRRVMLLEGKPRLTGFDPIQGLGGAPREVQIVATEYSRGGCDDDLQEACSGPGRPAQCGRDC